MADGDGSKPVFPIWLAPLASIIGASVVVTLWGAALSGRISSVEQLSDIHEARDGHEGMIERERRNSQDIDRLQWQMEQLRRELMVMREACPDIAKNITPTSWPRPILSNPTMQQTSVP